jgi:L-lactate dehydrogenase complex protein LldG
VEIQAPEMTARDEILGRIRAIAKSPAAESLAPAYHQRWDAPREAIIARFAERLADYNVAVLRARGDHEIRPTAERALGERGIATLVIPPDLPATWRPKLPSPIEDHALGFDELDGIEGVMTGSFLGIAETGSIVLDTGLGQGRRALTLLPDYHLCVVRESAVLGSVPEAIAALQSRAQHGLPITFFSGPSATADIELDRVAGVHGPRTLDVILVA